MPQNLDSGTKFGSATCLVTLLAIWPRAGAGDSNPGPLGTKSRVLDHSAPRGHSPGKSAPWGITPWGIVPLGNHPLGNRPPAQFNSNCYWKFRVTPNDWPSQRPNVLPSPLRKPPSQVILDLARKHVPGVSKFVCRDNFGDQEKKNRNATASRCD